LLAGTTVFAPLPGKEGRSKGIVGDFGESPGDTISLGGKAIHPYQTKSAEWCFSSSTSALYHILECNGGLTTDVALLLVSLVIVVDSEVSFEIRERFHRAGNIVSGRPPGGSHVEALKTRG